MIPISFRVILLLHLKVVQTSTKDSRPKMNLLLWLVNEDHFLWE